MTDAPFWCKKCKTLYENKCTCVKVKAEYECDKFIVINNKYLDELSKNENFKFQVQDFKRALSSLSLGLPLNNKYYACNQDEPYSKKVIDTILDGESAKNLTKELNQ